MEKFFSFNKFFLLFCLVFVLEWVALQVVSYMRLTNTAKLDGERILSWSWPAKKVNSIAQAYDTKILSRSSNDAVIKVLANQTIQQATASTSRCAAVLTYYRTNNQWFLGKVEFE